jgi:hypothetical protein
MDLFGLSAPRFALVFVAALGFAACGSSAGTFSNDAAVVSVDADLGVDGVSCAALPCLAKATSLIAYCAPSGTCTAQVTVSGGIATTTKCFSNGVKIQFTGTTAGSGGVNTVMSVKKDGASCYSFAVMGMANGKVGSGVYRDGAGANLFTEMVDGATATYTCPGESPIDPGTSCDAALFALQGDYPLTKTNCASGTCTF